MGKIRDRLKSTIKWDWNPENTKDFNLLKTLIKSDALRGIKRLTSSSETPLVNVSDWSKKGSGFCLYEVTCKCPINWPKGSTFAADDGINTLCCPDNWRLILAGGRYNNPTEAGYAPVEGEMLAMASALHKSC